IECLQLFSILYRSTDITDVITNTLGVLIGYLLYCLLKTQIDHFFNEKTSRS
ncbi:MAG TPA: hypothetical protein DCQ45_05495, partial [Erysipelotrichaceae bacterium]|nr:hypothetical protein [Erysipelotrichaceae bacterium]